MQFDLSFLTAPQPAEGEDVIDISGQSHCKTLEESCQENQSQTGEEERSMEIDRREEDIVPSQIAKVLEEHLNNVNVDAGLAASAVGLDLSSVAQDEADGAIAAAVI